MHLDDFSQNEYPCGTPIPMVCSDSFPQASVPLTPVLSQRREWAHLSSETWDSRSFVCGHCCAWETFSLQILTTTCFCCSLYPECAEQLDSAESYGSFPLSGSPWLLLAHCFSICTVEMVFSLPLNPLPKYTGCYGYFIQSILQFRET